jgi:TPR repeat protein
MKMTLHSWMRLLSKLRKKAEDGDPEAQWELGSWLEDGFISRRGTVIVPADERMALHWFRLSASGGCSFGQLALGNYLSSGTCTKRDDVQALFWYKRALRGGCSIALNNIAVVYRNRGNHRRALFWYQRAAAARDGDALVEVGKQLYSGQGVRRDPARAVRYFRKAITSRHISQSGRELAMFHLGLAYHQGKGVTASNARALEWLARANHEDDLPAARALIKAIQRQQSARVNAGYDKGKASI